MSYFDFSWKLTLKQEFEFKYLIGKVERKTIGMNKNQDGESNQNNVRKLTGEPRS